MAAVKVSGPVRFDVAAVRARAGDKFFGRGEAYHRDGLVEIVLLESDRVLARVVGTDDYRTELRGGGKIVEGRCSCPAFDDWGFCKHLVALALAANNAAPAAQGDCQSPRARIRDYLAKQRTDALADMILELAEQHLALYRTLDQASKEARDINRLVDDYMSNSSSAIEWE